ncbi:hypothetical protein JNUCC1_00627 [Lentibacillus sp. JNUCC-1]|uniref:hypothetical protein n=1 Tax=Lentibacillus sp. JNUCC-1 TaxID=2654513 RepID=UPI0012E8D615|nr:hypothetical protein [Lentibacillus sp. JNUCC-1]MUV36823.1 hypothetical protein [Lentibacillus sp. JNUCC-1]
MDKETQIISMLESILERLDTHGQQLHEHGQILTALRSGQEHLKAEVDGLTVSTAKEFGALKEQLAEQSASMAIMKDDIWKNRADIQRIKTTMGMS